MTLIPFTPRNPAEHAVQAFSRHATDCLHLTLQFAVSGVNRADLAWQLDSSLKDLEMAIYHLRRVAGAVRWDPDEL